MGVPKYPKFLKMGDKYNKLTVVGIDGNSMWKKNKTLQAPQHWKYWCQCECGGLTSVSKKNIVTSSVKSCGCLNQERIKEFNYSKRKTNPIEVCGDITKIFFFNAEGECTIIDTEDYAKVKDYCWSKYVGKKGDTYANARNRITGKGVRLHQILCPCEEGFLPDHENGDGLDNRKKNLRPLTNSQNQMNKKKQISNKSGCVGVYWDKRSSRWLVYITVDKKRIRLGSFKEDEFGKAVEIRKEAEEKYFGEYSYDNSRKKKEK